MQTVGHKMLLGYRRKFEKKHPIDFHLEIESEQRFQCISIGRGREGDTEFCMVENIENPEVLMSTVSLKTVCSHLSEMVFCLVFFSLLVFAYTFAVIGSISA